MLIKSKNLYHWICLQWSSTWASNFFTLITIFNFLFECCIIIINGDIWNTLTFWCQFSCPWDLQLSGDKRVVMCQDKLKATEIVCIKYNIFYITKYEKDKHLYMSSTSFATSSFLTTLFLAHIPETAPNHIVMQCSLG